MRSHLDGRAIALALGLLVGCAADPALDREQEEEEGNQQEGVDESSADPAGEGSSSSTYDAAARRPLPIVLLHGAAGFDRIGPLTYFFGVADTLEDDGKLVFTTSVDPLQRIEVRAGQLAEQIDQILADTGADQVHLIAHSQGGLDARFLISSLGYGDRVATLTTISTPHLGSRLADVALGILPGPAEDVLGFLVDLLVGGAVGSEQDVIGQINQLTERYVVNTFNPANPDDPRVQYFSVGGVTQLNPFVNPFTTDICDPLLVAGFLILRPNGASDAVVSVESSRRGQFLGTVPADHFDEVGQLLGTTALGFNHRSFYRRLARFLTDPSAPAPL
jgi:triacylglycerol lipase